MKRATRLVRLFRQLCPSLLVMLASVPLAGCPPHTPSSSSVAATIIQGPFFGDAGFIDQTYVAIDPATHNLLVTDSEENLVYIFSANGVAINSYPSVNQSESNSSANGYFAWPAGIAVDPSSRNMVVADSQNNRIQIFSPSDTTWAFSSTFGSAGSGTGQFKLPYNVAIDPVSHNILVADSGNNRIQEFTAAGSYLSQFGSKGSGTGQFENPLGVAVDPATRNILVGDGGNSRVQVFDQSGNHLFTFGSYGAGDGQFGGSPPGDPANFNSPMGVAVDPTSHNIVVTDGANSRVEIFSPSGQFLSAFGSRGAAPGQFATPVGVAVDAVSCNTVVVDYGNRRVEIFPPSQQEAELPSAVTDPATLINPDLGNHLLHGTVSTGSCGQNAGSSTTVAFQYAFGYQPPTSYPYTVAATPNILASGLSNQPVTAAPALPPCNTYIYFRVVATNETGSVYGNTQVIYQASCE